MTTAAKGWTVDLDGQKWRIVRRDRDRAFIIHLGHEMRTLPADHPALAKVLATLAGRA